METGLQKATEALLSMNSKAHIVKELQPSTVLFQVSTVQTKRKKIVLPLIYSIELEIIVDLDETSKTYSFSGKTYERTRFSVAVETFRGVYRRKEWGKYVTHDGETVVKYDTGAIFDEIETVLQNLGWRRA